MCRFIGRIVLMRISLIFIFGFITSNVWSQNHYNAQQYGAAMNMMGGADIAGVRDNSAIFYNPGSIGLIENSKISLSANIYSAEIVKLKNVAGKGIDGKSTRFLFYPEFVGGSYHFKKAPALRVIYGLFTRNRNSVKYNINHSMNYDVIVESPNNEYYVAELDFEENINETWAGVGFGYKFLENYSIGISMFGNYMNLENKSSLYVNMDGLLMDSFYTFKPYTAAVNEFNSLRIDHVSLIWKLGFSADFGKIKAGLTFTFPSARIWGQGRIVKTIEAYNLNYYSNSPSPLNSYSNFLIADDQSRLKAYYKNAPSISLGLTYLSKKVRLSTALDYYLAIPEYNVVRGVDRAFVRPAQYHGGQIIPEFLTVKTGTVHVVNVSLGLSYEINEKFKVLTGFRTDFNNRNNFIPKTRNINLTSVSGSQWHLLHLSLGGTYNRGLNDITAGINYGIGIQAGKKQAVNFSEPLLDRGLRGQTDNSMIPNVHSISFVIGYTYYLRANPKSSESPAKQINDL